MPALIARPAFGHTTHDRFCSNVKLQKLTAEMIQDTEAYIPASGQQARLMTRANPLRLWGTRVWTRLVHLGSTYTSAANSYNVESLDCLLP